MIRPTPYCDVCGNQKKSSNNWWMMFVDEFAGKETLVLAHWNEEYAVQCRQTKNGATIKHICGQGCATKAQSVWMTTGTLDFQQLVEKQARNPNF